MTILKYIAIAVVGYLLGNISGGVLIALVPLLFLLAGEPSIGKMITFSTLVFVLCILVVVLANTWAKKKSK